MQNAGLKIFVGVISKEVLAGNNTGNSPAFFWYDTVQTQYSFIIGVILKKAWLAKAFLSYDNDKDVMTYFCTAHLTCTRRWNLLNNRTLHCDVLIYS